MGSRRICNRNVDCKQKLLLTLNYLVKDLDQSKPVAVNDAVVTETRNRWPAIKQFRYIEIKPKTIELSTRHWEITTELVGFISQSHVLRSIV